MEDVEMTNAFWKRKRVLITGHSGFKGSWLSLWLQRLGANVCGFSLPPQDPDGLFHLAAVGKGMKSVWGDITDRELLSRNMSDYKPDIVFHLAAQPLVRKSYVNPVQTYMTNVMGTVHLFEAVRNAQSVKVVVNVTTDKCYQNNEWVWSYRENEPMGGSDPYSSSKACSELISSAYRNSFFQSDSSPALATVRAGNVVGGGDWAVDRIIPDIVRSLIEERPLSVRNPSAVRPWQHVLDPLYGYMKLAEKLWHDRSYSGGWNFGPSLDEWITVKDIIDLFVSHLGKPMDFVLPAEETFHEAHLLRLDSSKSAFMLKWRPVLAVKETLRWTADWYLAFIQKENMREFTLQQLNHFQAIAREHKR